MSANMAHSSAGNAQRLLSDVIGRNVIMKTVKDKIPTSTAANSGFTANHPMATITPTVDMIFAMLIMLIPVPCSSFRQVCNV